VFSAYVLSAALLLPPLSVEELIHQPFAELFKLIAPEYSHAEVHDLRSRLEQERDAKIQTAERLEKTWKQEIASARRVLAALNTRASADSEASALRRSGLHVEIAALERSIQESIRERDRLGRSYDLQFTKLWIADRWPARHAEVQAEIQGGHGRDRRHGDVEDTGYRTLAKDSEKDIETGKQAVRQMQSGGWLPAELRDEDVQAFVRRVAQQIAANSDLKVPLHVTVLDSADLKAVALPGGFLYITSGVVAASQDESELAGVLSREIARIAARHAARSAKVPVISRMFLPITQIVGGIFAGGPANPAAYYGIGYGLEGLGGVVGRAFSRTNESFQIEADQLGVQYAWSAGYNPAGFIGFLDSIKGRENEFLTESPAVGERILKLFDEIDHLPKQMKWAPVFGDFERIRRLAAR